MAIEQVTIKRDDLDGTEIPAGEGGTVSFALYGQTYELELSNSNKEVLEQALAPFIGVARKVGAANLKLTNAAPRAVSREASGDKPYKLVEARKWLAANGYEVSKRGPIQDHFLEVYEKEIGLQG